MFPKQDGKLKISADYRVNQPINNFKIRIKIVQQKSPLAELFESEDEVRDTNFLEAEEMTFKWQEKVFNSYEINYYSDEKHCTSKIHKNYHEIITNNEDIQGSRIFSYIQQDSYYCRKNPTTKSDYKSFLCKKNETAVPTIKNRKPFTERYNKKVVELKPTDVQIRSNHYLYKDTNKMYLVADLSSKDQTFRDPDVSEILLCTLTYDKARKILTVDPDFNNDEPYIIEEAGMNYDYWIEHASKSPTEEEIQRQQKLMRHEMKESMKNREFKIFTEIKMPPHNVLRLYITFDFTEAHSFVYDAVFLTYTIDLPKYWSTNQRDNLSGRTQRCRMVNGHAHFSHTGEISLDFDLNCLNNDNVWPSWPHLLIGVASLDKWTRYRIEGYTSLSLPPLPGTYEFSLKTWRPVAGIKNDLRRFFTGGTAELEDIKYCGIPRNYDGPILDKTELKTVPSGTVELRMNIVQQSQAFLQDLQRSECRYFYDDCHGSDKLMNNIENVLAQFRAARERMIHAKNMSLS